MEPSPPAVEAVSLNCWTTKFGLLFLFINYSPMSCPILHATCVFSFLIYPLPNHLISPSSTALLSLKLLLLTGLCSQSLPSLLNFAQTTTLVSIKHNSDHVPCLGQKDSLKQYIEIENCAPT